MSDKCDKFLTVRVDRFFESLNGFAYPCAVTWPLYGTSYIVSVSKFGIFSKRYNNTAAVMPIHLQDEVSTAVITKHEEAYCRR